MQQKQSVKNAIQKGTCKDDDLGRQVWADLWNIPQEDSVIRKAARKQDSERVPREIRGALLTQLFSSR